MSADVIVVPWERDEIPTEKLVRQMLLEEEGLSAYRWSNRPRDVYEAHVHEFHKVLYVVQGAITFTLPDSEEEITLNVGDRLELPAGVAHSAIVGPQGVACIEAQRW